MTKLLRTPKSEVPKCLHGCVPGTELTTHASIEFYV